MRDSVSSGYPNTEKRVENMMHSGVFLHWLDTCSPELFLLNGTIFVGCDVI